MPTEPTNEQRLRDLHAEYSAHDPNPESFEEFRAVMLASFDREIKFEQSGDADRIMAKWEERRFNPNAPCPAESPQMKTLLAEKKAAHQNGASPAQLAGIRSKIFVLNSSRAPVKPGMEPDAWKAGAALLAKLEARRLRASSPPAEPVTCLYLANKPISTPGNITTLISKSKTGKTAVVGGISAATVAAALDITDADTLGFTASKPDGKAVVLIDTEQSEFDAFVCYTRFLDRAGANEDPAWLHPFAVAGWSAQELRAVLRPAIEQAVQANGGVFLVILDGVADFVSDVNDPKESNAFVAELHGLAIEFNCAIICVIHSNEAKLSGDDGRGHLGKQLTRKAESNLLLKKVGEVTTITSEKQRKAPITEADGVAFTWSDSAGRHVSCKSAVDSRADAKRAKARDMAEAVFAHMDKPAAKYADLVRAIQDMRKVSASTAEDRFTDMKKLGVITKCPASGLWTLNPVTP